MSQVTLLPTSALQSMIVGFKSCVLKGWNTGNVVTSRGAAIFWLIFYAVQYSWLTVFPTIIGKVLCRKSGACFVARGSCSSGKCLGLNPIHARTQCTAAAPGMHTHMRWALPESVDMSSDHQLSFEPPQPRVSSGST